MCDCMWKHNRNYILPSYNVRAHTFPFQQEGIGTQCRNSKPKQDQYPAEKTANSVSLHLVPKGLDFSALLVLLPTTYLSLLGCVLVMVIIALIKHHDQKQIAEERVYLTYASTAQFWHHQRQSRQKLKQGRNLQAGAVAEVMKECCLLACSLWLA